MANLGLEGPWELTDDMVDQVISALGPGNYALGYTDIMGNFIVLYIGRSDYDLNDRLHDWTPYSKYKQFKASYATSAEAAFEKECRNYHDFGGSKRLENESHPDRPDGTDWVCPNCEIFD